MDCLEEICRKSATSESPLTGNVPWEKSMYIRNKTASLVPPIGSYPVSQHLTHYRNLIQPFRTLLCIDEGQEAQNSDLQLSLFGLAAIPSHVLKLLNNSERSHLLAALDAQFSSSWRRTNQTNTTWKCWDGIMQNVTYSKFHLHQDKNKALNIMYQ